MSERFSSTTMMLSRALGEFFDAIWLERPSNGDLVEAQPELCSLDLVDAEQVQGLRHIKIAFASGDHADLGLATAFPEAFYRGRWPARMRVRPGA